MYSNQSNVENRIDWIKFLRDNDYWCYWEMRGWSRHKWSKQSKRQRIDVRITKSRKLARSLKYDLM